MGWISHSVPKLTAKSSVSLSLNPVITALSSNCPQSVSEVSESRQSLRRWEGEAVIFLRVLCSALLRCFRCRLPPLPPFHISLPVPPPLLFISLPVTEFKRFCMTYMRQKHCSRHAAARSTTIRPSLNKASADSRHWDETQATLLGCSSLVEVWNFYPVYMLSPLPKSQPYKVSARHGVGR